MGGGGASRRGRQALLLAFHANHIMEMVMYQIVKQDCRKQSVFVKPVGCRVEEDEDTGEIRYPTLRAQSGKQLKMLKMILSDGSDHAIEIKWSNYHDNETNQFNPGVWRIYRITKSKPVMLYVSYGGRTEQSNGSPVIDYVEMAKRYGSTYEPYVGWDFGEAQVYGTESILLSEEETIENFVLRLRERFDSKLAFEILGHFASHRLFIEASSDVLYN